MALAYVVIVDGAHFPAILPSMLKLLTMAASITFKQVTS